MTHWKPSSGPEVARRRSQMLQRLRAWFAATNALEVATPALSQYAVSDPQIESLEVRSTLTKAALYLHTSPEFCMKRLLAAGYPDSYSICRVFRDGEAGSRHQPEFTMIEWYRLGFTLEEIVADTVAIIAAALDRPGMPQHVTTLNYSDAFENVLGIHPGNASISTLAAAADADPALQQAVGDERDDWLDLLLTTKILPTFAVDQVTVLQHYPAHQAALARLCPVDDSFADRFEIFIGSIEVANGYVELTDAVEQDRRIATDQKNRVRRNRPVRAHDESLLLALECGLPECAGVAMGLERLQMIYDKTDDIRDVVTFAFRDNE